MAELLWSLDELARFTRWEDPEVRYWAIDRLTRHYPTDCCDVIAGHLIDDHDNTPNLVARHLGRYGSAHHHSVLLRGFRVMRGVTPGYCLESLIRLGYPGALELAAAAAARAELEDSALGVIVSALVELDSDEARRRVRELGVARQGSVRQPPMLRALLTSVPAAEVGSICRAAMTDIEALSSREVSDLFHAFLDGLQVDDVGWCLRTRGAQRLEFRKTLKAVESGYDCDVLDRLHDVEIAGVEQALEDGAFDELLARLVAIVDRLLEGRETDGDDLPRRLQEIVRAVAAPPVVAALDAIGHEARRAALQLQLSVLVLAARYFNIGIELKRARGDLDRLLELGARETAFHLDDLPDAISVVCRDDDAAQRRAQDWCLRLLEAQGPFFPKVVALETLGELRAVHFVAELLEYVSDDNTYVYSAAERALGKLGDGLVGPARRRIEDGSLDPESAHSLLILLCDLGTQAAFETVLNHLDWFMAEVQPGATAEWVSLFGREEFIEPLRDWLEEDPAAVGQALLLLGAIHNVRIPEEEEILQAIEQERSRRAERTGADAGDEGSEPEGDNYVM